MLVRAHRNLLPLSRAVLFLHPTHLFSLLIARSAPKTFKISSFLKISSCLRNQAAPAKKPFKERPRVDEVIHRASWNEAEMRNVISVDVSSFFKFNYFPFSLPETSCENFHCLGISRNFNLLSFLRLPAHRPMKDISKLKASFSHFSFAFPSLQTLGEDLVTVLDYLHVKYVIGLGEGAG